jgi:mannose-6-phosphate isomerase class I
VFEVPVPDFRLTVLDFSVLDTAAGQVRLLPSDGPHLVLSGDGEASLTCGTERRRIQRWESVYVAPGEPGCTVSGTGQVFVASTNL